MARYKQRIHTSRPRLDLMYGYIHIDGTMRRNPASFSQPLLINVTSHVLQYRAS
jgi:hypothetical protein